jgi:hypothetical protein
MLQFNRPGQLKLEINLDLASMQFGEEGRGKGGEKFILGSVKEFQAMAANLQRALSLSVMGVRGSGNVRAMNG